MIAQLNLFAFWIVICERTAYKMTSSEQSAKATCSPLTHTQTPDPELRLRWRYKVEIRVNENTKWQIGMERNCANQSWGLLTNPIVTQTHTRS